MKTRGSYSTQKILGADGREITRGGIVAGEVFLYKHQGFVVDPHSNLEDQEHCVAVFFGTEVDASRFNPTRSETETWDRAHQEVLNPRTGDYSLLITNNLWQNCPRVVFFKPEGLVVENGWSLETLADRLFGRMYHTLLELPRGILPHRASDYQCFRHECRNIASKLALWNIWGSVYPIYVCDSCFPENNAWCADVLPQLKNPFLSASGTPIAVPAKT